APLHLRGIELAEEIERLPALGERNAGRQIQIEHRLFARAKDAWLIHRRKKRVRVDRLPGFDGAARIGHHDVARKRLALRPQAIQHPRSDAGKARDDTPREQLILRRGMDERVGLAGTDDRQVVGAFRRVRQEVRYPKAALAALFEGALRAEQPRLSLDELALDL